MYQGKLINVLTMEHQYIDQRMSYSVPLPNSNHPKTIRIITIPTIPKIEFIALSSDRRKNLAILAIAATMELVILTKLEKARNPPNQFLKI
jgi:hypothetical protein